MVYEEIEWWKEDNEDLEIIMEANERVFFIVSELADYLRNSSMFDLKNSESRELSVQDSAALRKLHNIKNDVLSQLEKERDMACGIDSRLYLDKRRATMNRFIDDTIELLNPLMRGRVNGDTIVRKSVNFAEKIGRQFDNLHYESIKTNDRPRKGFNIINFK